jgi:predicted phage tail protein
MALLGGLAQLLAPQPEDDKDELRNRYLGAPRNTVAIGTRIAIPYGRRKIFGHYLSFDINATTSTKAS